MREQDQLALTRFLHNSFQPVDLFHINRVISMGSIEPDQKPMSVLNDKVARGLFEFRKDGIEICVAARVHFVITVERAADLARARRAHVEETLLRLLIGTGIVDVANMQQHLVVAGPLDGSRRHGRTVKVCSPVADYDDAAGIGECSHRVVGRWNNRMPSVLVDVVKHTADPAPNVTTGKPFPELRLEAATRKRRTGITSLRHAALQDRSIAIGDGDQNTWTGLARFFVELAQDRLVALYSLFIRRSHRLQSAFSLAAICLRETAKRYDGNSTSSGDRIGQNVLPRTV